MRTRRIEKLLSKQQTSVVYYKRYQILRKC